MHLNNSAQIAANNYGEGPGTSIAVRANTLEIGGIDDQELGYFLEGKLGDFSTPEQLNQWYPQMGLEDAGKFLNLVGQDVSFGKVIETFGKQKLAEKYRRNFFVRVFNLISIGNRSDSKNAGGGKIQIIDVQNLQMDTGMIEAYTVGGGNAGEITVNANQVTLTGLSGINAAS